MYIRLKYQNYLIVPVDNGEIVPITVEHLNIKYVDSNLSKSTYIEITYGCVPHYTHSINYKTYAM